MIRIKENYIYILSAILVFISIFNIETPKGKEHLICKWVLIIGLSIFIAAFKLGRKYHWSLGLLFSYFGLLSIFTYLWPLNNYFSYDSITRIVIGISSAKSFIASTALIFFISLFRLEGLKKLEPFFIFITVLNSVVVIYQWLSGNDWLYRGGLFDNVSTNGCIIGACYPLILNLVFNKKNKYAVPLLTPPVVAVLCSMSSVAVGVMGVAIATFAFVSIKNIWLRIPIPIACLASILTVGYFSDKHLFDDSQRFELYKIQYQAWEKQDQLLLGYGTGAYRYFGVRTQIETKFALNKEKNNYKGQYMLWLHNDWLQLLLEGGLIGAILILIVTLFTTFYAWDIPYIFSCLIAFMSSMVFHYPIHYPIHGLFGLWLLAYIYLQYKGNRLKNERN